MTLTLTQCVARAGDLAGEIKAAKTVLEECLKAEDEREQLFRVAATATLRARDRLYELIAERETLAQQAHSAIMAKGEPYVVADESVDAPRVGEVVGLPEGWGDAINKQADEIVNVTWNEVHLHLEEGEPRAPRDYARRGTPVDCHGCDARAGDFHAIGCTAESMTLMGEQKLNDAFDRATHPQDDTGQPNGAF